jgi:nitric oxide reductase NorQ protein
MHDVDPADPLCAASRLEREPWYLPIADEVEVFEAAAEARLPVLLRGPTGCGKTRFVEHVTWRMHRRAGAPRRPLDVPLLTVACHDDLSATDLVGRWLLSGDSTVWHDGPLTRAVRSGAVCYLDELVEARRDTTVVIHPLTDHRRVLPIEKTGELLDAHPDFMLVVSYNPAHAATGKELKPSTRQRFVSLDFGHPPEDAEAVIVAHESGVAAPVAARLAAIGARVRHLEGHGLDDGVGTRLLVNAGKLIARGVPARRACEVAIARAATEDPEVRSAIVDVCGALLP